MKPVIQECIKLKAYNVVNYVIIVTTNFPILTILSINLYTHLITGYSLRHPHKETVTDLRGEGGNSIKSSNKLFYNDQDWA